MKIAAFLAATFAVLVTIFVLLRKREGKTEYLDGRAKFMQLWLIKAGVWKMSRILSYDHGPANR